MTTPFAPGQRWIDTELLAVLGTSVGHSIVASALAALLARHRAPDIGDSYSAYDEHPFGEADEWGDLASFRRVAAGS